MEFEAKQPGSNPYWRKMKILEGNLPLVFEFKDSNFLFRTENFRLNYSIGMKCILQVDVPRICHLDPCRHLELINIKITFMSL
jgi:hypothetical protein